MPENFFCGHLAWPMPCFESALVAIGVLFIVVAWRVLGRVTEARKCMEAALPNKRKPRPEAAPVVSYSRKPSTPLPPSPPPSPMQAVFNLLKLPGPDQSSPPAAVADDEGTVAPAAFLGTASDVSQSAEQSPASTTADDPDLEALRRLWLEDIKPKFEPEASRDPFLSPPFPDRLLLRFLDAERGPEGRQRLVGNAVVRKAADRLMATATFRRDYDCLSFHRKGAARRHMMHITNAGASAYFGAPGLHTRDGYGVLLGRTSLMVDSDAPKRKATDDMLAAQHLRAALLVTERAAVNLMQHDGVAKGGYILDVGSYPTEEMAVHDTRYWNLDGLPETHAKTGHNLPCAGPCLPGHHELKGLAVLKEAMQLLERHYPETMGRIFFYRPSMAFRVVWAIARLWAPKAARDRFVLVRPGEEQIFFDPPPRGGNLRPEDVPKQFGGTGPSLDGDRFLLRACELYEKTALLPASSY